MNLEKTLLAAHSRATTNLIVQWIGHDQQRFDELFNLFITGEYRVVQRAAWPLSYAVEQHPSLIRKHFTRLLKKLEQPGIPDAVKRNTMRLLQSLTIPRQYQGTIMNKCFDFITDPREKPAIKAFSLTVLDNLSAQYPEIKNELRLIIESQWDNESPAFRSRAAKILRKISKTT